MSKMIDYENLEKDFASEVTKRFLLAIDTVMGNRKEGKIVLLKNLSFQKGFLIIRITENHF